MTVVTVKDHDGKIRIIAYGLIANEKDLELQRLFLSFVQPVSFIIFYSSSQYLK
jgi:hypothetical protein